MTALWHRQHSGDGQWIDLAESETAAWLMGEQVIAAARAPGSSAPRGNRHAVFAPQGCYRCRGDDRWLTLSARSDAEWTKHAARIGGKALDPVYANTAARHAAPDALDAPNGAWEAQHVAKQLKRELEADGISAGMVYNTADLARNTQNQKDDR